MVDFSKATAHYRVLAGIDFSIATPLVLRRALEEANRNTGAELHLLHVMAPEVRTYPPRLTEDPVKVTTALHALAVEAVADFVKNEPPLEISRVVTHALVGSAAAELVWLAASIGADLIVVGSHGRRGLSRLLLGSVAEHVVRRAGCPVLIERMKKHDEAWVTPEIEPPCRDCLEARLESGGAQLWCARHSEHHARAHTYSDGADSALSATHPWGFSG